MGAFKYTAFMSLLFLAGCATQEPAYTWVKTETKSIDREYAAADSICLAEAYKAAPDGQLSDCVMLPSSMAQKACLGKQTKKTKTLRAKIYDGCMMGKGWEKQPAQ